MIKKFDDFVKEELIIQPDLELFIDKIPGEITKDEFDQMSKSPTTLDDHELMELNILFGDLEGRVGMWEPDKEFLKYEFEKIYGGFGQEQIFFKGYIIKQKERGNFLISSFIRYRYSDYFVKKPIYLMYDKISNFANVYKNLPKIISVHFLEKE